MLNTSVTHIAELEEAIKDAIYWIREDHLVSVRDRLRDAAESFGLEIKEED